ncbi:DUF998 domain-containing protein [Streptomyces sp. NPDC002851]
MRLVPWWAVLSSGCAPVLLVGGWTVAAIIEGPSYDPAAETISVMAADGAAARWVLTGALVALGVCHLVTAWGLRVAALAGRWALGCGGVAVIGMALSPVPKGSGGSLLHGWVVGIGFALMALWPVLASDGDGAAPWGLRPVLSVVVCVLIGVGAAWFLIELQREGAAGVAERILTTAQTVWPFVVVASCLGHRPRTLPPVGSGAVD